MKEPEGDERWALVDLLLWTAFVLIVVGEVIYLVGHRLFRIW